MFNKISTGNSSAGSDMDFGTFISRIRSFVGSYKGTLYQTDSTAYEDVYLNAFSDPEDRCQHNCRCCLQFIKNYAGLVYLDDMGRVQPAIWPAISSSFGEFSDVVAAMHIAVRNSTITNVFVADNTNVGVRFSGGWNHLAVDLPQDVLNTNKLLTPHEVMAKSREDFRILKSALTRYPKHTVTQARSLVVGKSLPRTEIIEGHTEWLFQLHTRAAGLKGRNLDNLIWKASSTAPVGFASVASSTLGSLMDDLQSGMTFDSVKARFTKVTDPLRRMRPTTAPSSQNVAQGETVIEKLGLTNSLKRKFAKIGDLELVWAPKKTKAPKVSSGVFRDVKTRDTDRRERQLKSTVPEIRMTFHKFQRDVLPLASSIKVKLASNHNFAALVTAEYPDSPCIMQWGNHVNWYVYPGGSSPTQWNLRNGSEVEVTGICLQPNQWSSAFKGNNGEGVHFILKDCRDTRRPGAALFPEVLISELHPVRKTIEAYSGNNHISGSQQGTANGIKMREGSGNVRLSVTIDNITTDYCIDRMD